MLQWRPASSSARAHGQAELFQLISIISDACRATELMKRAQTRPKPDQADGRGRGGAELATPSETRQYLRPVPRELLQLANARNWPSRKAQPLSSWAGRGAGTQTRFI